MVVNIQLSPTSCVSAPLPPVPVNPLDINAAVNQVNGTAVMMNGGILS
jgi:hypothetical protein